MIPDHLPPPVVDLICLRFRRGLLNGSLRIFVSGRRAAIMHETVGGRMWV